MKSIAFTNHATHQIHERQLSKTTITSALESPDKILKQDNFRRKAVKLITRGRKKYAVIVIYEEGRSSQIIITAFITSKVKKYVN